MHKSLVNPLEFFVMRPSRSPLTLASCLQGSSSLKFIPAGEAWQMCRNGLANPDSFGIFDMHGLGFVRGNLVRDIASLNGMELLPWDVWGIMETEDGRLTKEELGFLDEVASLALQGNTKFSQLQGVYRTDARIQVPDTIVSYTDKGPIRVRLQ